MALAPVISAPPELHLDHPIEVDNFRYDKLTLSDFSALVNFQGNSPERIILSRWKRYTRWLGSAVPTALLGTMVGYLQSASYNWLSQLLGPLGASESQWRSWGATIGGAAASRINAVISAIQRAIGFFSDAIDKAVSFGKAVGNLLGFGGGAPAAPAPITSTCRGSRARRSRDLWQAIPCR